MIGKENRNKINLKQHTSRPRMRILALMLEESYWQVQRQGG